jgi:hypothetical protein
VFLEEKQNQNCDQMLYCMWSKVYAKFVGKYPDTKVIESFIANEKKKYAPKVLILVGDPNNDT